MFKELGKNPLVYWGLGLYFTGVMTYFGLTYYFHSHRPHTMDAASGHIYPLKHRGSTAYLTKDEDHLLRIVQIAPYVFLVGAMLIHSQGLIRRRE